MNNTENWLNDGQDISQCCIKCGSTDVATQEVIVVEHAPLWATYLGAVGLRFIYKIFATKAELKIGLCQKHSSNGILKRILAYTILLLGAATLGFGVLEKMLIVQLAGVAIFIAFFFVIRSGNIVKIKGISDGKILLHSSMHTNT